MVACLSVDHASPMGREQGQTHEPRKHAGVGLQAWLTLCLVCAGSPRGRAGSNSGEVPLLPEARGAPKNTFSVEQGPGPGKRDPKEAAARGWAKLRDTVKSAKSEAQTVVSARTAS